MSNSGNAGAEFPAISRNFSCFLLIYYMNFWCFHEKFWRSELADRTNIYIWHFSYFQIFRKCFAKNFTPAVEEIKLYKLLCILLFVHFDKYVLPCCQSHIVEITEFCQLFDRNFVNLKKKDRCFVKEHFFLFAIQVNF